MINQEYSVLYYDYISLSLINHVKIILSTINSMSLTKF